jgi:competence protein CoiA
MALSALVNGEIQLACLIDVDTWTSLRKSSPSISMLCCGGLGFMRRSRQGTQHFVHATDSVACDSAPESARHLRLKSAVAQAVSDAGWSVEVEVLSVTGDWRADVLATKNDKRIVFEVQLSAITQDELLERQGRYRLAGIRGCWFINGPFWTSTTRLSARGSRLRQPELSGEPFFECDDSDCIRIGHLSLPIQEAVRSLLCGEFRFCRQRKVTETMSIRIFRFSRCWGCGKDFGVYSVMTQRQDCMNEIPFCHAGLSNDYTEPLRASAALWVEKRIRDFIAKRPLPALPVSILARQTATESRRSYFSFRCAHCNALTAPEIFEALLENGFCSQDDSYLLSEVEELPIETRSYATDSPHWCFSSGRAFCSAAGRQGPH